MDLPMIASALRRVEAAFVRRPAAALEDDRPATARWTGGLRTETLAGDGAAVHTDMPTTIGGDGSAPTPGWYLRTALASCAATRIAMAAAAEGIVLTRLEVQACSRSDKRGLFGMRAEGGEVVPAAPIEVVLEVRVAAPGVPAERLHALVAGCDRLSPVSGALRQAVPMALQVEVEDTA
jgi:uncharacterized OsmC-like protein